MIKYKLEFGIGKRETFTVQFLSKTNMSAIEEANAPEKIRKDIEKIMYREGISEDNGWHNYEVIELSCLGGGFNKLDELYDLIDMSMEKFFQHELSKKEIDDLSEYFNKRLCAYNLKRVRAKKL